MNGAILGMKRVEIQRKFAEIVAFAGIDKFLDTPVKRYSSGSMCGSLSPSPRTSIRKFSLVDEVLAVGDTEFQQKCLGKMHDVSAGWQNRYFYQPFNGSSLATLPSRDLVARGDN